MASVLWRKLTRDLAHHRGQMIAIALMMALGIALFVSLRGMNGHLTNSRDRYYRQYRFGDVFASVKRAPRSLLVALAAIPGVAAVEGRVVADVVLDLPGSLEAISGRLVSIPDVPRPGLNDVHLRMGSYPSPRGPDVIASAAFTSANRLTVGDTIAAIVNGRRDRLRIGAIGQSPEYVYEIPSGGVNFLPDNRRFGVLWVPQTRLEAAFDMAGSFNDLTLTVARGANRRSIIETVDLALAKYGGRGGYDRDDQISHRFVSDEIAETNVTSILLPSIFLGVTAFILSLTISRLVATEREQIALVKAFGFTNATVVRHYLAFIAIPAGLGAVAGIGLGFWFARYLAGVYARFFQFPAASYHPSLGLTVTALAVAGLAATLGGAGSVRAVTRLPPAESMRPPTPPRFRPGPFERIGWSTRVSPPTRVVLRNIERQVGKSALTVTGLGLALAIVIAGWYAFDAIELLRQVQFFEADRAPIRVAFDSPKPSSVRFDLARLPGVRGVELTRLIPIRLRHGNRTERTALQGLAPGGALRRLIEPPNISVSLPNDGLLLATALATRLGAKRGDLIAIEALEGDRRIVALPLAGTVDELMGMGAYLDPRSLARLFGERDLADAALLDVDRTDLDAVEQRLKRLPAVAGVSNRHAILAAFDRTIAESFRISLVTIFGAACLVAAAVVYNSGRIALSERARELASLRVLGFSRTEVATMLLGEQALLTVAATPLGITIGYLLCRLMTSRFAMDLFRLPLVIKPSTYLMAVTVVWLAAALTSVGIWLRVRRLDLVAVLKARE